MPENRSCTVLPLAAYPAINPLALDLVRGEARATQFFSVEGSRDGGDPIERTSLADALKKTNRAWGNGVDDDVDAWARGDATAIIAGQQVGFGGGPLYTLVKLASLVHYRRRMAAEGRRVVAFFWMATEDHDFDEVTRLTLWDGGKLHELRSAVDPNARFPVGALPVPDDLRRRVATATGLPEEGWLEPGLTMRDSFARLISSVAGGDVILVDSLLPELRRAGSVVFKSAAEQLETIPSAISQRSADLEQAGYKPQVQPSPEGGYTLFYEIGADRSRRRLESADELGRLAESRPETISTAALMRPLLQDAVFAPEAFVGGPAEVAYYAQLGSVYQALGVDQPRVMLRAHSLVVPQKLIAGLERHGIEPEEWLDSPEAILSRRELEREKQLSDRIGALRAHFEEELDEIRASILEADASMTRSLNRTVRRVDYHLGVLDRRGRRVIARSDQERFRAVERFANVVRPGGVVQDRFVGWLSFWLIWGDRLLTSLEEHSQPDADRVNVIGVS